MKTCPYCAEQIQDAAVFCKHCKRDLSPGAGNATAAPAAGVALPVPQKPQTSPVAWGYLLLLVLGFVGMLLDIGRDAAGGRSGSSAPVFHLPESVVTEAEFDQIQDGMTYQQVVQIIGAPGEELSRSSLGGTTTVMYAWRNPGGANMNAMFQGGALISKAQMGLR